MIDLSKTLIFIGLMIAAAGVALYVLQKSVDGGAGIFNWFGNLPLDFKVERDNFRFYFPLGTSILLSLAVSFALYLIRILMRFLADFLSHPKQ